MLESAARFEQPVFRAKDHAIGLSENETAPVAFAVVRMRTGKRGFGAAYQAEIEAGGGVSGRGVADTLIVAGADSFIKIIVRGICIRVGIERVGQRAEFNDGTKVPSSIAVAVTGW